MEAPQSSTLTANQPLAVEAPLVSGTSLRNKMHVTRYVANDVHAYSVRDLPYVAHLNSTLKGPDGYELCCPTNADNLGKQNGSAEPLCAIDGESSFASLQPTRLARYLGASVDPSP